MNAFCSCGSVLIQGALGRPICTRTQLAPSECLANAEIHRKIHGAPFWTRPASCPTRRPRLDDGGLGR